MYFGVLFIIAFIVILYLYFTDNLSVNGHRKNNPKQLGEIGENYINQILQRIPGENYIINDLIIKDQAGKTTQIDHIVINKNGVFVIETKNYAGRIYGNDLQQEWIQVLNYGKRKHRFYNPVKQNATHIYKLKEITGTKLPIKSIVVFIQGNIEFIESKNVYAPEQLKAQLITRLQEEITKEQIEEIYNKLVKIKEENTITTEDHIKNITKTIRETEQGICPRCGGKLTKRNSQYGTFYGCSNYPKCKFTKK